MVQINAVIECSQHCISHMQVDKDGKDLLWFDKFPSKIKPLFKGEPFLHESKVGIFTWNTCSDVKTSCLMPTFDP